MSRKKQKGSQKQVHLTPAQLKQKQLQERVTEQLALPEAAKRYMLSLSEEERKEWKPSSLLEIARKAEVDKRIGSLLTTFYHIQSVQGFLTGEIENWLDGFNLYVKGVRPAMNDLQRAVDRYFDAMGKIVKPDYRSSQHDYYLHDVDALHEKIMSWEGYPKHWEIGEPLKLAPISAGQNEEGSIIVYSGHEEIQVDTVTLPAETRSETTAFCVSRLNADETADIVKAGYKTEATATRAANRYAKEDPDHPYVVYRQTIRTQEVATLQPIKAAQNQPTDTEPTDGNGSEQKAE